MALPRVNGAWGSPSRMKPEKSSFQVIRAKVKSGSRNRMERWDRSWINSGFNTSAIITPYPRSASMAGRRLLLRRIRVNAAPPTARRGCSLIIPNPSTMKLKPNPSMIPRTTGFVVTFSIQVMVPVTPIKSQKRPVKIPDPQIIPWVIVPAWEMAIPPIAFMG